MSDVYAYLIVYGLGGESSVFWATEVRSGPHHVEAIGYTGEELRLSYTTPHVIKEKDRGEVPKNIIADIEDTSVGEVDQRAV